MDEESSDSSSSNSAETNIDSMVNSTVLYLLSRDASKQPVKRSDIIKHAFPSNGKMFPHVMAKVKEFMGEVLGLKLIDLEKTEKLFITISKFKKPEQVNLLRTNTPDINNNRSLLVLILAYIFMEDDSVEEERLMQVLTSLKLVNNHANFVHPLFGNVQRLVTTDFVRQMYLKMEKPLACDAREVSQRMFKWGPRAHVEFSKREILSFVSKMQSNVNAENFTCQWKKMIDEEEAEEF